MTRPQIIRADTLDLQDQHSPSAQDHSRQPAHPAPLGIGSAAPHQATAIRNVNQERSAEEHHLSDNWSEAATMNDEPLSDDERAHGDNGDEEGSLQRDELAVRQNGGISGSDDADLADADVDDGLEDDNMDRISSSPSIDDGGYNISSAFPRDLSLSTPNSRRSRDYASPTSALDSSPFTQTPLHLPLSAASNGSLPIPFKTETKLAFGLSDESASSPYPSTPVQFPFCMAAGDANSSSLDHHHGEYCHEDLASKRKGSSVSIQGNGLLDYTLSRPPTPLEIANYNERFDSPLHPGSKEQFEEKRKESSHSSYSSDSIPSTYGALTREVSDISFHEEAIHGLLLPDEDPLLDDTFDNVPRGTCLYNVSRLSSEDPSLDQDHPQPTDLSGPPSPSGSSSSWCTASDLTESASGDDDDESSDVSFSDDERFCDTGWGSECLQDTEDIDFDFVYALHTFQAVVEGQANATKGDTMVLLDDSNSYWWLVRIVKDGSIGYLPAEHIETPTERLARLNKHRNIDLSATMLGDNTEKSKNPLKKAMRRRNAKTVAFAAPTYVEASDYDYSSDEDENGDVQMTEPEPQAEQEQQAEETEQKDDMAVEPLKLNGAKKEKKDSKKEKEQKRDGKKDAKKDGKKDSRKDRPSGEEERAEIRDSSEERRKDGAESGDRQRTSDEIFDQPMNPKVSKNGTVRNTDSFFKDDTVETRKITLTPMLFRDDNSSGSSRTVENKERTGSFDNPEPREKAKEDKKRKEKKPGMLSGLFKRKDKKKGAPDGMEGADEKLSEELSRGSPQPKSSDEASIERFDGDTPQRQSSKGKLQKMQPRNGDSSPPKKRQQDMPENESPEPAAQQAAQQATSNMGKSTMRVVSPTPEPERPSALRTRSPESQEEPISRKHSVSSEKSVDTGRARQQNGQSLGPEERPRPSIETDRTVKPSSTPQESRPTIQQPTVRQVDRLSESPVQISPVDVSDPTKPPGLIGDSSSQEDPSISPVSPSSSPSLIDVPVDTPSSSTVIVPHSQQQRQQQVQSPAGPPPARPAPAPTDAQQHGEKSRSTPSPALSAGPAWSDAHLRTYFEDGSDVRDLLLVVHDTSGVVPVSQDHPIMAGLFEEEKGKLGAMGRALDGLLVEWLDRRRKTH